MLLPFLGFPGSFENFFICLGGFLVATLTFLSPRFRKTLGERVFDEVKAFTSNVFVENKPPVN